jgi:hypothetical protein
MCEWSDKTTASVLTPDGLREVMVDSCMKPLVEGLGKAGVATLGCCCGHGRESPTVLLADGKTLYVLEARPWECCWLVRWAFRQMARQVKHRVKTWLGRMVRG